MRPAAFRTTATTASVCASGEALRAITRREVFRWLFLLELSDLLGDVFLGFLALYFVDDVGTSVATGGLAVAVWTGAGLAGAAAMIPLLRRIDGLRYLRASAAANAVLFVGFLLVPAVEAKLALVAAIALVSAGWYSVLQARLYGALAGASGLVLTVGALFPLNAALPLGIAGLAERCGLDVALWPLLAAPFALLLMVHFHASRERAIVRASNEDGRRGMKRVVTLVVALAALVVAPTALAAGELEINVVSSPAEYVSGGDADRVACPRIPPSRMSR